MKILILAFFTVLTVSLFAQEKITLQACLDSVERTFPVADQRHMFEEIEQLQQSNLSGKYLPQLNFNAKASYQSEVVEITVNVPGVIFPEMPKDQYSANVEISQIIYDGGNVKATKDLVRKSTEANINRVEVDLQKVKEQVAGLFFKSLLLQESEKIVKLTKSTIEEQRKLLKTSVEQGVINDAELFNLDAELLRTDQQIIEIESDKKQILKSLQILTGIEMSEKAELVLPQNSDEKTKIFRPEHALFLTQSAMMDANIKLAQRQRMPRVIAFANAGYGKPGYDFFRNEMHGFYIVGAQLQWNIWDWKQSRREQQQYTIQKYIIEESRKTFDKNLDVALSKTAVKKQKLKELIVKDEQIVELQKKISDRTAKQMNSGTKTSAEYLQDLNAEKQAMINLEVRKIMLIQAQINEEIISGAYYKGDD